MKAPNPFRPVAALYRRLARLWRGGPGGVPAPRAQRRGRAAEAQTAEEEAPPAWPPDRIRMAEALWGDGYITPGGSAFLTEMVQLMGISDNTGLLNLGAGLGGPACTLASDWGAWVTAIEPDPDLTEAARRRAAQAGLGRRAQIEPGDLEAPMLKERAYDLVVSLERLFTVADKEGLFAAVAEALRPEGYLLFTDLVLPGAEPPNDAVRRWFLHEPERPHLWTARQTIGHLNSLALEVRTAEDVTEEYRGLVLHGWYRFVSGLTKADLTPEWGGTILRECQYWLYRMAALESGGLRFYRFRVLKS